MHKNKVPSLWEHTFSPMPHQVDVAVVVVDTKDRHVEAPLDTAQPTVVVRAAMAARTRPGHIHRRTLMPVPMLANGHWVRRWSAVRSLHLATARRSARRTNSGFVCRRR